MVRQALVFLAHLIIARNLGSSVFGGLTLAFSIYVVMAGVGDFGARFYSWKSVLEEDPSQRQRRASALLVIKTMPVVFFALLSNLFIWLLADGAIALLLHIYSLAIVFNQVAFGWYFLSLDKMGKLSLFNAGSGVIYLASAALFIRTEEDMFLVPVIFAASFALPALALIGRSGLGGALRYATETPFATLVKEAVNLLLSSAKYMPYAILKRFYHNAILIIAGGFYGMHELGLFRAAHLVYTFMIMLATYLGASYFNRVFKEVRDTGSTDQIAKGVGLLAAGVIPLSVAGQDILPRALGLAFGPGYAESGPLFTIMLWGLVLPALSNFVREVVISADGQRHSAWSLAITITVTAAAVTVYHPPDVLFLAYALLAGEAAGLVYLFVAVPHRMVPLRAGSLVLVTLACSALLKGAMLSAEAVSGENELAYLAASMSLMGALFAAYAFLLRKFYRAALRAHLENHPSEG